MEFKINDRVRVKDLEELKGNEDRIFGAKYANRSGECGTIIDRLFSEANQRYVYSVMFDGSKTASRCKFTDAELELAEDPKRYDFSVSRLDDKMYAAMYIDGEEFDRAWGIISEETDLGILQAASHAMKTLYFRHKQNHESQQLPF